MKLRRATIENFRGIQKLEIDFLEDSFTDELVPRPLTCIVGDNGAGKTSALQAIGLVLWLAGGKNRRVEDFAWEGLLPERIGSLGNTRVELEVGFTDAEIDLTTVLFDRWLKPQEENPLWQLPRLDLSNNRRVATATFVDGAVSQSVSTEGRDPFLGRWYLGQLSRMHPELAARQGELGTVVWFEQTRRPPPDVRPYLVGLWAEHTTTAARNGDGSDPVSRFNENLDRVFPGLKFVGVKAKPTVASGREPPSFYCLFERGGMPYDLTELSSGEQAVFPFAYEFALNAAGPSVVLIDELELHLHPLEQQALLGALTKLAPKAQFVITTHSRAVTAIVPESRIVRLLAGRPCL